MASPQLEKGFMRIALELVDALARVELSPNESRILWVVLRQTYGWKKKADAISLSFFCESTGLSRKSVCRSIGALQDRNILVVNSPGTTKTNIFEIQKNYEIWDKLPSVILDTRTGDIGDTRASDKSGHQLVTAHTQTLVSAASPTKDNKDTKDTGFLGVMSLEDEVKAFKKMGWEAQRIKDHFLMRELPEKLIDQAMGKEF